MFISSTKTLKIELNGDGRFIASPGVERPEGQLQHSLDLEVLTVSGLTLLLVVTKKYV